MIAGLLVLVVLFVLLIVYGAKFDIPRQKIANMIIATFLVVGLGLIFQFRSDKTMLRIGKIEFHGVQVALLSWCAVYTVLERVV